MEAVAWHGTGGIRLDDVPEPALKGPTNAIVRLTATAVCGTDLHFIRGTCAGMTPGAILGHEGVGVVEEMDKGARSLNVGDRVVTCSTPVRGKCPSAAGAIIRSATRPARTARQRGLPSSAAR